MTQQRSENINQVAFFRPNCRNQLEKLGPGTGTFVCLGNCGHVTYRQYYKQPADEGGGNWCARRNGSYWAIPPMFVKTVNMKITAAFTVFCAFMHSGVGVHPGAPDQRCLFHGVGLLGMARRQMNIEWRSGRIGSHAETHTKGCTWFHGQVRCRLRYYVQTTGVRVSRLDRWKVGWSDLGCRLLRVTRLSSEGVGHWIGLSTEENEGQRDRQANVCVFGSLMD